MYCTFLSLLRLQSEVSEAIKTNHHKEAVIVVVVADVAVLAVAAPVVE